MKYSNDLVSVVIPVYNSEKFLKESIDSVLNQTYQNLEIIAVDDGSTDNSAKILKEYSDRITIISQSNQGLASALNSGIKKIKGKWFKWFSPDDVMNPDTIETLVKKGMETGDNCIIYSNWVIIDEKGKFLRSFSESNYNDLGNFDFNVRLLDGQQINVNTTLVPRSIFSKGLRMRDLDDHVLIDYDFFLRIALLHQTKFYLIEKPLIKYRVHQSQLSHQNITSSLKNLETVKEEILSELSNEKQNQYRKYLKNYRKKKPLSRKSMDAGLKLISIFPNISDKILIFYLNKIRRTR